MRSLKDQSTDCSTASQWNLRTFSNSHTETERVWRSVGTTGQVNSLSWDTQACLLFHFPFSPTCMCFWLWPYPFKAGVRLKKFFRKFVRPNYRRSSKLQYRTHKVMLLLHNKSWPVTEICQNVECMSQSMKYLIDDAFLIRRTWCEYMFLCCSIRKT